MKLAQKKRGTENASKDISHGVDFTVRLPCKVRKKSGKPDFHRTIGCFQYMSPALGGTG